MKKILIISLFIILAVPTSHAIAAPFDGNIEHSDLAWAWLISDNRQWSDGSGRFAMMASFGFAEEGYQNNTYIRPTEYPWTDMDRVKDGTVLDNWGKFFGIPETGYLYNQALGWPDPLTEFYYPWPLEPTTAHYGKFYETAVEFRVGSDPDPSKNLYFERYIPDGTLQQLGFADATITGGANPTISWADVTDANVYRLRIVDPTDHSFLFDAHINFKDPGVFDPNDGLYKFTYLGDLFQKHDMLGIAVEARQYFAVPYGTPGTEDFHIANQLINRSRIYYEHSIPEPATMLLLGTALIGLAALRRRVKE